jgi:hypothetical protein
LSGEEGDESPARRDIAPSRRAAEPPGRAPVGPAAWAWGRACRIRASLGQWLFDEVDPVGALEAACAGAQPEDGHRVLAFGVAGAEGSRKATSSALRWWDQRRGRAPARTRLAFVGSRVRVLVERFTGGCDIVEGDGGNPVALDEQPGDPVREHREFVGPVGGQADADEPGTSDDGIDRGEVGGASSTCALGIRPRA